MIEIVLEHPSTPPASAPLRRRTDTAHLAGFPRVAGMVTALMGLLMVVSWHAGWRFMLQPVPNTALMKYNTAVGFLLAGLGLYLLTTTLARRAWVAGGLVGLMGALTVTEFLLRSNLGLDQLLHAADFTDSSFYPGRMSPLAAGCFVLTGTSLVALSLTRRGRWVTLAGLGASIVVVISFVALLGYAFDTDAASSWGSYSRMAINTAALFLLWGTGVLTLALRLATKEDRSFMRWVPVTGSLTLIVMIAFVSAVNQKGLTQATFWRKHTIDVIIGAQSLEKDLVDIQRNLRAHVTSGEAGALAAHRATIEAEPALFERLVTLTANNPGQQSRLGALQAAEQAVLDYDRQVLEVYRVGGYEAFARLETNGQGRALTGRARELLTAFSQEEQRLLDLREATEQKSAHNAGQLFVVSSVMAAILLIGANYMTAREMSQRRRAELQREALIGELKQALQDVKTLSGMIPICGWCKSIRDDKDYWQTVEQYVCSHTDATFTHGICPGCADKLKAENAAFLASR